MTPTDTLRRDLVALFRAKNTLLWLVTREELRAERLIADCAAQAQFEPVFWDCATGLSDAAGATIQDIRDPQAILRLIRSTPTRRVYVLRDLHRWLDPVTLRLVRSAARELAILPRESARCVVVLTPSGDVPPELAGAATVIDVPLPGRAEIGALLDSVMSAAPAGQIEPLNGQRDAAIDAAVGLTAAEAENCYARSLVSLRRIDPSVVASEKKRVIARERGVIWTDPDPRGLDAVGGLDGLKPWLRQRQLAMTADAREYGLPSPRGVLLVGVPGCGKSLTAKAVAAAWGVPLLRLDLGALKSKWVGESEGNIRRALSVAETVAPCVLWLDELEKALGGATQGAADGGVSTDALGAVLQWMQERQGSVFVVATANDVSALPPELLRKGRFDELFFVDLPNVSERSAIVAAALRQYGRDAASIAVERVARVTAGYTGAEIAALVPDAMFTAYADGRRPVTTEDLVCAAATVAPLSKTAAEKIDALRAWAKGRCRSASVAEADAATAGRTVEL